MDAINFGTECWFAPCAGSGPWVQATWRTACSPGATARTPATRQHQLVRHRAAQEQRDHDLRAQGRQRAIRQPHHLVQRLAADHRRLHPDEPGGRHRPGHRRRQQQLLGRSFFEGVMTPATRPTRPTTRCRPTSSRPTTPCPPRRRPGWSRPVTTAPTAWTTTTAAPPAATRCRCGLRRQHRRAELDPGSNGTIQIDGGCLDITGASFANGTLIEWWPCNGGANQQWQAVNGQLVNPPPASAWTIPRPTPPTALSSSCGPVTAAPTSSGTCPKPPDALARRRYGRTRLCPAPRRAAPGRPRPTAGSAPRRQASQFRQRRPEGLAALRERGVDHREHRLPARLAASGPPGPCRMSSTSPESTPGRAIPLPRGTEPARPAVPNEASFADGMP